MMLIKDLVVTLNQKMGDIEAFSGEETSPVGSNIKGHVLKMYGVHRTILVAKDLWLADP